MSSSSQDPTRRMPPTRATSAYPAQAGATPPPAVDPALGTSPAVRPGRGPRWEVDAGRFWAGVVSTALVAALAGIVAVVVVERILKVDLLTWDPFSLEGHVAVYAVGGAICAVLAGALLFLLILAAPRPQAFFGWIVALVTLVAALLPLTWEGTLGQQVATGIVNLVIGIAIWSLLAGVVSWTVRRTA